MAHAGWFGATSNTEIAQKNAYANDGSLTGMLHRWASEGFSRLPDAQAEYEGTVRPLVMRSTHSRKKDDELKALHALAQLMAKYRSKLSASNNAAGRSDSGRVMFNSSAQQQMSYSVGQPGGATGAGGSANVASSTKPTAASSSVSGIISTAESFVGRPYKWGGSNPKTSFDCSGLMQWSFGQNGVKLPRTAAQQQQVGADVPLDQLVPGDLVFYGSPAHHVAMYIGNGQMVEAPHTGANIHNTKLRAPTNARRVAGGGAGLKGVVSAGNPAAQGDSGTGPVTRSSANLSSVFGFGDEQSALASVLTPPSLFGGDFGGGRSGAGGAGSGRTTTSQSAGTPTGPPPGGTVGSWVKTALGLMHLDFGKYGGSIASIIQHESGGNPHAQNNWDSNAKAGHPSKGLMQTIDSTFSRWALPGHGDIWNPVDNIIAGTRYAMGRYGSLDNVPGIKSMTHGGKYKGYAQGSYSTAEGLAYLHNDEMVVPAQEARKVRAMIARKGQRAGGAVQSHQGSGGSGLRDVTIQAPITVVGKATQKDAQDFLAMVKDEIEQNHALESVGSG
jgi:SLT domain-containing protein/cell wall-associated NlpC family hydrolase